MGQFARDGIRYLLTPLLIFLALSILFHNVRTRLPFVCPVLDHYTMPNHAIGGATAGPTWGHDPSTARGRFAAPPPPPRPRCTRGVPLGRRGALGAAMRGHGHVYLILLSYCCGDRRPLHAEPRHHHGRAWGASPVAGGRELRSPGATDVNFRSQDARNADVLSHRDTALILLSPWPFRC